MSRAAGRLFRLAAVYGVVVLVPLFLTRPPAHPEWLYGFAGTALAFQLAYRTIGGDPVRYRPLMPVAVLAKLGFGVPCAVLFAAGRIGAGTFGFGLVDLALAAGFLWAWRSTESA